MPHLSTGLGGHTIVYLMLSSLFSFSTMCLKHPIYVEEHDNYHVIVVTECSWVYSIHDINTLIPWKISKYPLAWNLPCDIV